MERESARLTTADLCDEFGQMVGVAEPIFTDYGGAGPICGPVATVEVFVFEDNVLVREAIEDEGGGRVLVVDGKASTRGALIGDKLARLAHERRWSGIVVNGGV